MRAGAGTVALGRVHERNFFYVAPLVLLCFFTWVDTGSSRPRLRALFAAAVVAVLPAVLPREIVQKAGTDAIALIPWAVLGLGQFWQSAALLACGAALGLLFLRLGTRLAAILPVLVAIAFMTLLVVGEASALRRQDAFAHRGFTPLPRRG